MYRTIDIGQDQAENRESQRSRTDLSSKSRVKLNISLVKTLTAVADRPTVYVSVTPPCDGVAQNSDGGAHAPPKLRPC